MEYEAFVMAVRRDINCLSGDRNLKRNALVGLDGIVKGGNVSDEIFCRLFVEELHRPLFRLFGEASEKCRELSLSMTRRFIVVVPLESLANLLPLLLSALLGWFRQLPFPEQSEELRLEALQLLDVLFDLCTVRLAPFAGDIVDAISKALSGTCPDAKKECCKQGRLESSRFWRGGANAAVFLCSRTFRERGIGLRCQLDGGILHGRATFLAVR